MKRENELLTTKLDYRETENGNRLQRTRANQNAIKICKGIQSIFLNYAAISISKYSFFLLQNGRRASQYLRLTASRARFHSVAGRILAVPANSGPVILPRAVLRATL